MKVKCPGCNSTYKLDDNRIPDAGLKMRCPKCKKGFLVSRPDSVALKDPSPSSEFDLPGPGPGSGQSAQKKPPFKPPPAGAIDDLPVPGEKPGEPVMDLPAPKTGGVPEIADLPVPRIDVPEKPVSDLPAPKMDDLPPMSDLPAPKKQSVPPPVPGAPSPIKEDEDPFADLDLPAPKTARQKPDTDTLSGSSPFSGTETPDPVKPASRQETIKQIPQEPSTDDPFGQIEVTLSGQGAPADNQAPAAPPATDTAQEEFDPLAGIDSGFQPEIEDKPPEDLTEKGFGDITMPPAEGQEPAPQPAAAPDADPFGQAPDQQAAPDAQAPDMMESVFGDIDLPGVNSPGDAPVKPDVEPTLGGTDFGEVTLEESAGSSDEGMEFSAFPTDSEFGIDDSLATPAIPGQEQGATGENDSLDLAAPLPFEQDSGVIEDFAPEKEVEDGKKKKKKKKKIKIKGKRTLALQVQNLHYIALGLLLAIAAGGGMLHFTPYGIYGYKVIADLLPGPTASLDLESIVRANGQIKKDTLKAFQEAFKEFDATFSRSEPEETLAGYAAFTHYLFQLRFGSDEKHENAAVKLIGPIDMEKTEEASLKLAHAAKLIKHEKHKKALVVIGKPFTPVEDDEGGQLHSKIYNRDRLYLLSILHLKSGNLKEAEDNLRSLMKVENSRRVQYQLAKVLVRAGKRQEAVDTVDRLLSISPAHIGTRLLNAELKIDKRGQSIEAMGLLDETVKMSKDVLTDLEHAQAMALIGSIYFYRRNYVKSKQAVEKALKINPRNAVALDFRGRLYLKERKPADALSSFIKAKGNDPEYLDAVLGQSEALLALGSLKEAKEILVPLQKEHPRVPRLLYLLGRLEEALGNKKEAEARFGEAIALDEQYLEPYVSLSGIMLQENRDGEAMRLLDEARQSVPDSAAISTMLAEVYAARADLPSALVELDHAVALDPSYIKAHFRMAQIYRELEKYPSAEQALKEVEMRFPDYPGLMMEKALLLQYTGKMDEAIEAYTTALEKDPDNLNIKIMLGTAQYLTGKIKLAKETVSEVLPKLYNSPEAHYYMGRILHDLGKYADAQKEYLLAIDRVKNNAQYLLHYGINAVNLRNIPVALESFNRAIELDSKLAEAYFQRGSLRFREGSTEESVNNFKKALALDNNMTRVYEFLGDAYDQQREMGTAMNYYQKAIASGNDNGHLRLKLALIVMELKSAAKGLLHLRKSVELGLKEYRNTGDLPRWLPGALARLGQILHYAGKKTEAVEIFRKYLEVAPSNHFDQAEVRAHLDRLGYRVKDE